jgi:hypothetical protein
MAGRQVHHASSIFDALDDILKIVQKSEAKADAAQQIMKKYDLDAEQTDAILELKIYRLARLEILVIPKELEDKRLRVRPAARQRGVFKLMAGEAEMLRFSAQPRQISTLLKDESARWDVVRVELETIRSIRAGPRQHNLSSQTQAPTHGADSLWSIAASHSNAPIMAPAARCQAVEDPRMPDRTHLRHIGGQEPSLRGPIRTDRPAPHRPRRAAAAHGRGERRVGPSRDRGAGGFDRWPWPVR